MRSLGEFVGHIARAVKAPAGAPPRRRVEVRRRTEAEQRDTPAGRVTLRRTTIEEIDLPGEAPAERPEQP